MIMMIIINDDDDNNNNDDNANDDSTFELCSILSCANLSEYYNNNDPLNISIGRSIDRSTGKSTS